MQRRDFCKFGMHLMIPLLLGRLAAGAENGCAAESKTGQHAIELKDWQPFSEAALIEEVRALSQVPFIPPRPVPQIYQTLNYDQYHAIRFKKGAAIWLSYPLISDDPEGLGKSAVFA